VSEYNAEVLNTFSIKEDGFEAELFCPFLTSPVRHSTVMHAYLLMHSDFAHQ
jgi:hypothetical protein